MMQKVVLEGTGRKAILEGYTSAGKTGTAQKVDPATGAYSKTKYIGSFAGFAPLNNPQIVVAVILDSAVGLHQGGQVSAPVFRRISQQVLEYLHVPHDLPLAPQHQLLLAQAKTKDKDLEEGTPDHPGEPLETAEVNSDSSASAKVPNVARHPVDNRRAVSRPRTDMLCKRRCAKLRRPTHSRDRAVRGRALLKLEARPKSSCPPRERLYWTWSRAESKCRRSLARQCGVPWKLPRILAWNSMLLAAVWRGSSLRPPVHT